MGAGAVAVAGVGLVVREVVVVVKVGVPEVMVGRVAGWA